MRRKFKKLTLFGLSLLVGGASFVVGGTLGAASVLFGVADKMELGFDVYLTGMAIIMFGLLVALAIMILDACLVEDDR